MEQTGSSPGGQQPALPGRVAWNPTLDPQAARRVRFQFAGRWIEAYEGDTIASALHAAGVRRLSRSFKYHRPRGLLCAAGRCPNCLVNVDGVPHVRSCVTPVVDGMVVRPERGWPSVDRDAFGVIDRFDPLLPAGFYYKTFIHPRRLWPVYEEVLRSLAGYGEIDHRRPPRAEYAKEYRYADVAVIGGGPAGCRAALAAARAGAHVVLVDDQPSLGGHLRFQVAEQGEGRYEGQPGYLVARALADEVAREPRIDVLLNATAFGLYEDNLVGVLQGHAVGPNGAAQRFVKLRADRVVVATGRHEYLLPFQNNDLPGVMLGTGAQRLMHLYGVRPGQQALVVSANDHGLTVAADLLAAGVAVAGVVELRSSVDERLPSVQRLRAANVPLLLGHTIVEARGKEQVAGAVVMRLDERGNVLPGSPWQVACDVICLSTGFDTSPSLLAQAGGKLRYDATAHEFVPAELPPTVFAAGDVAGVHGLEALLVSGELAGLEAARSLGRTVANGQVEELRQRLDAPRPAAPTRFLSSVSHPKGKKFVCLCLDVTEKEICTAIAEGFDGVEYLKRYTTYSMGPCQGKMCAISAIAVCARETGRAIEEVGTTTARPPVQPVPLGALAGHVLEPTKITPMHHEHEALGARMIDTGVWRRPRQYGDDPQIEVRAVREGLGLIDVSTLGKLEVVGKDSIALLEKVLVNKVADLRVGRVRYWVLCDDAGIILDEGTITRLDADRWFLTTSTAGATTTEEWLLWWAAGTDLCVHVHNLTDGLASMNLAGPLARKVLAPLTDVDLGAEAFPYLAAAQGRVAGVPALMLRIGFVGELGYEIHVPAEYGADLWNALMEAGGTAGLRPFGLEAQRVLRLEKRHLIASVDTDALSTALEADLAWAVKFDKPDFIGRAALLRVQERGPRQKLVGYVMEDPQIVPQDGAAVLLDGRPVGRVTSARFSPTLGQSIGMAWVPIEQAMPGTSFQVRVDGKTATARVVAGPFYDPHGERMRG